MNVNPNMPMNAMGGPVGAPVPMMNNGALPPQAAGQRPMQIASDQRTLLNTYIYEYFIRNNMYECARQLLSSDQQVNVYPKDGSHRRRDENGNPIGNGLGDDPMDTDSKDDVDAKLPDDLPAPKLPMPASETSFLYDWFCLFWDIFNAQRKPGTGPVNQYVGHTQQSSRIRQNQQQELLRQMRPDGTLTQQQYSQMLRMQQNGAMGMGMKQGNLARAAMANNQNNPQAMQMLHQAKQNQMQRDPSDMDGNRQRPASPGSSENAPSPSKRPRLDGAPFNPNQPGMVPNGAPRQGMPGQQVGNAQNAAQAQAAQMLLTNGINPSQLTPQQFSTFSNQPPQVQAKSIATYAANLQQHQASQMPNKSMPNASGPQGQGSPMLPQNSDPAALTAYYNAAEMGPGAMRPGPGGPGAPQAGGGSNHALQDYQMQLMLLEQQNKKRLMMARQEQDNMGGGMPRGDGPPGPGGPPGPNGQAFPDSSPQGVRTGASPNPTDQMKRGTPQMNNAGIPSPLPEGAQSRGSPINFMPNGMDPSMAPNFFTKEMQNMGGNMVPNPQMTGMRPPSSHPGGQPFNGQMNPQMMAAARQQQQQAQGGNPQVQWQQQGPNGQMVGPGQPGPMPGQQRSMPPPSAPGAVAANAARTNTSSPQQPPAPPTPSQANKAAPKKKDSKASKSKAASQKKSNSNLNAAGATPAADNAQDGEAPTPTPMTPVNANANAANFNKNGQNTAGPSQAPQNNAAPAPAPAPVAAPVPPPHADASQNGSYGMEPGGLSMDGFDFVNPLVSNDVLNDFDFDSFLHDEGDNQGFDFNATTFSMENPNEIGAD